MVEHFLGKEEVKGSIPFNGSAVSDVSLLCLTYRRASGTLLRFFEILLSREENLEE